MSLKGKSNADTTEEKKKGKPTAEARTKENIEILYEKIAKQFIENEKVFGYPHSGRYFMRLKNDSGETDLVEKTIVEENKFNLKRVFDSQVSQVIHDYMEDLQKRNKELLKIKSENKDESTGEATVKTLIGVSKHISNIQYLIALKSPIIDPKTISPIGFKDTEGYCFERLPFIPEKYYTQNPCPSWENFLQLTSDPDTIEAFIGSCFDKSSDRSQCLVLYGEGNNGKSVLARFLKELLPTQCGTMVPPSKEDRFFNASAIKRRLNIFTEMNKIDFLETDMMKSLLGDDYVRVEEKGERAYYTWNNTKYAVFTNREPFTKDNEADKRRILYVVLNKINKDKMIHKDILHERLMEEAKTIISRCWFKYLEKTKDMGTHIIQGDQESLNDIIYSNEAIYREFMQKYLIKSPYLSTLDRHLREICANDDGFKSFLPTSEFKNLKNFLSKNGRVVKYTRIKGADRGDSPVKSFYGFGIRPFDGKEGSSDMNYWMRQKCPSFWPGDDRQWVAYLKGLLNQKDCIEEPVRNFKIVQKDVDNQLEF
jgi:hypothetical protein